MGSEVQLERYMPGYCSTSELCKEASSHAWKYYDKHFHEASVDFDTECDKNELKQKMLEHDTVFRRQVSELHRLYRTQRDLMDDMKRSKLYTHRRPLPLYSLVYQSHDSSKLHSLNFPSSPNFSLLKRKAPKKNVLSVIDVDEYSKECEIIECRPAKARRQMFDLHLSADAYIDQSIYSKAHIPRSRSNDQSFFCGPSRSTSNGNGKKDLNRTIQIEDDPPTVSFMDQKPSVQVVNSKPFSLQTPPKNYSRETSFNSHYGESFIDPRRQLLTDRENNRAQASHQLSLGKFDVKGSTLSQYLLPERSQQKQFVHGKNGTSCGTSIPMLPNQCKDNFWKDGMAISPTFAEAGLETRCWPPPLSSWEKQGCNSMKKQPCFISSPVGLSKSSQTSNQPSMFFEEKLNLNSSYVVGIPRINELDHGSSSGSKEESICYPSVKLETLGSGTDVAGLNYSKDLIGIDLNCCEEMDLSASVANDSHHEIAKMEQSNHASLLPWMKPKSFSNKFLNKIKTGIVASQCPPQMITESASGDHKLDLTKTITDHASKQIHGFPVFAQPLTAGSFRLSRGHKSEMKQDHRVFDMNVPWETEPIMEKIAEKKLTGFKNFFDLNSCLTSDETWPQSDSSVLRNIRRIDLEAPAPLEIEDSTLSVTLQTPLDAEFECVAAEAMVSFSSLTIFNLMDTASVDATETLKWFVSVISSCSSDSQQQSHEYPPDKNEDPIMRTSSDEPDYFEQMTLNLTEMTTEEHMPKNAFPTISNIHEEPVKVIAGTCPRRGQARRRGRPKRDFQRDILPTLTSLSRHEVTEDLQAFDGVMTSSGHAWQYGKRAAARNKPRRGRPRTVNIITPVPDPIHKQPTNVCIGTCMEDRNLIGWGNTTRRPRRQRCPAGSRNLCPK